MILGLDISTSITGVSLVNKEGDLVFCAAWRTDKKGLTFFEKLSIFKDRVEELKQELENKDISAIYVEEPFGMYASGRSSAQVISKIQRFNGACCWILKEVLMKEPQYIKVNTARKLYGIKLPRGCNTKEVVLKNVSSKETNFSYELTKKGNCVKGTYDRADSVVIARAGISLYNDSKKELAF